MANAIKRFALVLGLALPMLAQQDRPTRYFPVEPTGACSVITELWNNWVLGHLWQCTGAAGVDNGHWQLVSAGASTTPTGPAGGALTGTYPNPTLHYIGTEGAVVGSDTVVPRITIGPGGVISAIASVNITGTLLSGTLAAIPATCTPGQYLYQATDQAAGSQNYYCPTANTWALIPIGGGLGTCAAVAGSSPFSPLFPTCQQISFTGQITINLPTPVGGAAGLFALDLVNTTPTACYPTVCIIWGGATYNGATQPTWISAGAITSYLFKYSTLQSAWTAVVTSASCSALTSGQIQSMGTVGCPAAATSANIISLFSGGHSSSGYGLATDGSQQPFGGSSVACAGLPALTGAVTTSAGSCATSLGVIVPPVTANWSTFGSSCTVSNSLVGVNGATLQVVSNSAASGNICGYQIAQGGGNFSHIFEFSALLSQGAAYPEVGAGFYDGTNVVGCAVVNYGGSALTINMFSVTSLTASHSSIAAWSGSGGNITLRLSLASTTLKCEASFDNQGSWFTVGTSTVLTPTKLIFFADPSGSSTVATGNLISFQ